MSARLVRFLGRYFHPHKKDGQEVYAFCHDFQNGGCSRNGCKFIHCSADDEEYYKKTGELLPHVHEAYRRIIESLDENGPVCKDYFKGLFIYSIRIYIVMLQEVHVNFFQFTSSFLPIEFPKSPNLSYPELP